MKYDYILIDLDGTITDSYEGLRVSMSYMMDKLGYKMPDDKEFRKVIGPPLMESFESILHINKKDYASATELYRQFFQQKGYKYFSIYTGMRNVIRSLKREGIKLAIATSKPIEPTEKLLKYFGIYQYFDTINAPEHDGIENSKVYVIEKALKYPHKNALMIGDRYFDANGAKEFSIDFMGAAYGFGSENELLNAGAKYIANAPLDILKILDIEREKGKFISLEGMDGSGKSTQVKLLNDRLKRYGFSFVQTREPGGTRISEEIRQILLSCDNDDMTYRTEALLYAASRAQHVEQHIRPSLNNGNHVICDRFVDSSIAYQGAGRELGVENVSMINDFAINGLYPDRTVLLEMPTEKALRRRENAGELDRLEREKIDFFNRTNKAYIELKNSNKNRIASVNADDTIENVANEMFITVASALEPEVDWVKCKYE